MLLPQGQIYAKNVAFCVRIGCVRLGRYCGKRESCDLFPYAGLVIVSWGVLGGIHFHGETKETFSSTYTSLSQQLASTKSSDKTSTTYKENCRGVTLYRLDEMCMLLLLGLWECCWTSLKAAWLQCKGVFTWDWYHCQCRISSSWFALGSVYLVTWL